MALTVLLPSQRYLGFSGSWLFISFVLSLPNSSILYVGRAISGVEVEDRRQHGMRPLAGVEGWGEVYGNEAGVVSVLDC